MSSLGSNFFVLCTYTYSTNCAELACSIPLSVFNSPLCIFGCDCDHRQFCLSCFTSRLSLSISNNICSECGSKVEALSYLAHNLVLNQFVENYCEINLETESDIPTESDNEKEVKLNNNYNNNYNNINYNNNSSISEDKKEKKIKRKRKKRNISASGPLVTNLFFVDIVVAIDYIVKITKKYTLKIIVLTDHAVTVLILIIIVIIIIIIIIILIITTITILLFIILKFQYSRELNSKVIFLCSLHQNSV